MARQVLDNGVILPSEYSDDWYDDMTSNLTKLDEVIGSDAEKLDESDVGAAALSNSYDDLNNLPSYGITRYVNTAITDNSNVAFASISSVSKIAAGDFLLDTAGKMYVIASVDTANETAAVTTPLTQLAIDSGVVHKSGNETVGGDKTFNGDTRCVGELNQTVPFKMTSDTSFVTGTKNARMYDQNGFQCVSEQLRYNNSKNIRRAWSLYNNSSGTIISAGFNFILSGSGQKALYPITDSDTDNGSSSAYWKNTYSKQINSLTPSSLSLPGYTVSRLDISGYITDLTGGNNNYTVLANGYIFVRSLNSTYIKLLDYPSGVCSCVCSQTADDIGTFIPVIANRICIISIKCSSIDRAYFIPCLGNI